MAASSSSSLALPLEASQAITAFLAGAYDDDKVSLVEVDAPAAILSPFTSTPPSLRLIDLIKHLGPSLTSEDEMERSRAVVLLSLIVINLSSDLTSSKLSTLFDKQATLTLSTFFASKIEDGNTVASNIAQSNNAKTETIPGSAPEYKRKKYPQGTEMLVASIRALISLAKQEKFASEAARATAERCVKISRISSSRGRVATNIDPLTLPFLPQSPVSLKPQSPSSGDSFSHLSTNGHLALTSKTNTQING